MEDVQLATKRREESTIKRTIWIGRTIHRFLGRTTTSDVDCHRVGRRKTKTERKGKEKERKESKCPLELSLLIADYLSFAVSFLH
jgi:hypothetical protein